MLTAIVQRSAELIAFINALNIVLYQPQTRHLIQMVDALLTSNEGKTISGLYRLWRTTQNPLGRSGSRQACWRARDLLLGCASGSHCDASDVCQK